MRGRSLETVPVPRSAADGMMAGIMPPVIVLNIVLREMGRPVRVVAIAEIWVCGFEFLVTEPTLEGMDLHPAGRDIGFLVALGLHLGRDGVVGSAGGKADHRVALPFCPEM